MEKLKRDIQVDIFATAIFHSMTVESLNELDLSYTPPLSSPWDPVQMAAQAWCRKAEEVILSKGVRTLTLRRKSRFSRK
jgi:hypothetical protein